MGILIAALLWFILFTVNLVSDSVSDRLNYGIASGTLAFILFMEFLEKSGYIGG